MGGEGEQSQARDSSKVTFSKCCYQLQSASLRQTKKRLLSATVAAKKEVSKMLVCMLEQMPVFLLAEVSEKYGATPLKKYNIDKKSHRFKEKHDLILCIHKTFCKISQTQSIISS